MGPSRAEGRARNHRRSLARGSRPGCRPPEGAARTPKRPGHVGAEPGSAEWTAPSGGTWVVESPKNNTRGQSRELPHTTASHRAIIPVAGRRGHAGYPGEATSRGRGKAGYPGGASGREEGLPVGWEAEASAESDAFARWLSSCVALFPGSLRRGFGSRAPSATNWSLLRRAIAVASWKAHFCPFTKAWPPACIRFLFTYPSR